MEHRHHKRHFVGIELDYIYRGRRFRRAQTLNLSSQGMLLATASLTPPSGMMVHLRFSLDGQAWDIPAVVVHSRPGQMGVMFQNPQDFLCQKALMACAS